MAGESRLLEEIERFERARDELREAVRDAHAATKDLRQLKREISELLEKTAKGLVDDRVGELVRSELDRVGPMLKEFSSGLYARVSTELDKLIDLSLGKEFALGKGREDLRPLLAEKLRGWLREIVEEGRP